MPLKQNVLDAFTTLGLTPDADITEATKAYKRLALQHHPDRNHGDSTATQRFQQIGAAWNICQRHYENPAWSNVPDHSTSPFGFGSDDDIPLDEEDLYDFYMFMFAETLFNRYSRASGQRYRFERRGHGRGSVFTYFGNSPEPQEHRDANAERQKKEKERYERRKRELELEIEEEEQERERQAKKQKAVEDRLATAQDRAFQAAYTGNSAEVQKIIVEFDLDVTAPRNLKQAKNARKQDDGAQYETLLHVAASHCDETLFMFLLEQGAKPTALNKQQLSPFHAAIKAGNSKIVRFILEQRGKAFQGYHHSKATPSGITPLQLAIESGNPSTVELLVKHATTHDVERCWKHVSISEEIKDVLRTKKGFVPPGEGFQHETMPPASKKVQRLLEQAQQKEAQIAEERRRAEINRQKKEERAAKREKEQTERARQEEERRKVEEEERQRIEEEHARQEETKRKAEEEERKRVEAEQACQEAAMRKAEEERKRVEAERVRQEAVKRMAEEERCRRVEEERRQEEIRRAEEQARAKELEVARLKAEADARDRAVREKQEKVSFEAQLHAEETQAQAAKPRAEGPQAPSSKTRSSPSYTATSSADATKLREVRPAKAGLSEEERKDLRRAKLKEKRNVKKAKRIEQEQNVPSVFGIPQPPPVTPVTPSAVPAPKVNNGKKPQSTIDPEQMDEQQRKKYEAALRRRAEQSARVKERHRRLIEERAKAKLGSQSQAGSEPPEYAPPTPVSTHTARGPVTATSPNFASPSLSFDGPLYMEDIQTCVVPEDLFRVERPPSHSPAPVKAIETTDAEATESSPAPVPHAKPYRRFYKHPKRGRPVTQHT